MHNLSIAQGICESLQDLNKNQATPINYIIVSIGQYSSLRKEHMIDAFDILRSNYPILKSIKIMYKMHSGEFECLGCGYEGSEHKRIEYSPIHGVEPEVSCIKCGSTDILLKSGTDIYLEEVGHTS